MSDAGSRSRPVAEGPREQVSRPQPEPTIPSQIGPHQVHVQDDLLFIRFIGPYLPEEARQVLALADQMYRTYGGCYMLADVRQGGPPGPETRRVIGTWPYLGTYVAALFGVNSAIRVLTTLLVGAQRLLGTRQPIRTELFDHEDEARAWLLEQRRLLRGS